MHAVVTLWAELVDDTAPTPGGHDWLYGTVLVALIGGAVTVAGTWLAGRRGRNRVQRILHQTENEHADAEYPNLREQLDAMHREIRDARTATERVEQGQRRTDSEISGLRRDIGRVQDADARVEQRLDGHVAETRREHTALVKRLDDHLLQSDDDRAELRAIVDRIDKHHPET
jgi:chromosome segregation ATPase